MPTAPVVRRGPFKTVLRCIRGKGGWTYVTISPGPQKAQKRFTSATEGTEEIHQGHGRRRGHCMAKQFPRAVVAAIDAAKIMGIRAGADHKFIAVWPVVVDGRVFARSWGVSRDGWYHAFIEDSNGSIQIGDREIRVRGLRARGERIRDKVEEAYAAKFITKASQRWVRGFKSDRRRDATIEFVPR